MRRDSAQLEPRKEPRQARSERTRQRTLDAATRVFTQYGYGGATTNRIAAWADISIGSLYQYYPNKDAILAALASRHIDAGIALAERRLREAGTTVTIESVISLMVRNAIDNHRDSPEFLRVLIEQAPRSEELMDKCIQQEAANIAQMRELLDRRPEVSVTNKQTAARLVVTATELVVHLLLAAADPIDIPEFEHELTTMLTRYLIDRTPPIIVDAGRLHC